ncbi:MAG: 3-oxoacyl-ACP reductase FabG [Candidatus Wallbacteria bacterium]|nr:3-oxoacyl-ACP reductase FabG [Candidatus Wallbacteria bacterium]
MKLIDKIALVTGGGRGIGLAIARELAAQGADVAIAYLKEDDQAEAACELIRECGRRALKIRCDIRKEEDCGKAAEEVFQAFGKIDILVNNAGITREYSFVGMSSKEWQDVLDTNLTGTFNMSRAAAKFMVIQKSGKIINLSSVLAQKGGRGQANYIASKGGIESLTRALAVELAVKNITVNAVAPGVVETEMSREVLARNKEKIMEKILLKRLGSPEEVAKLVAFLSGPDSDYITGQVISIDGGFGIVY